MSDLFEVREYDRNFYECNLKNFLPDNIIDIHTHVWLDKNKARISKTPVRAVTWPRLVAKDNSIEDLMETYRLLFPGKKVKPLIFASANRDDDLDLANSYIKECAQKANTSALLYTAPWWDADELKYRIKHGGFIGIKVYLNFAEPYIPADEIRIFDFLPHHQLEIINRLGLIIVLHIPRNARLKDPVNLAQMLEIEKNYPNIKLIIAHVGRAYCPEDVGNAFEVLGEAENMMFDISANCNSYVFEKVIDAVGPDRILFGSDLPILRLRSKRICEGGRYVNLVPEGLYGDVSGDKNMREVDSSEADKFTFFMYEEIEAFRKAANAKGLSKDDIYNVFYGNAYKLLQEANDNLLEVK